MAHTSTPLSCTSQVWFNCLYTAAKYHLRWYLIRLHGIGRCDSKFTREQWPCEKAAGSSKRIQTFIKATDSTLNVGTTWRIETSSFGCAQEGVCELEAGFCCSIAAVGAVWEWCRWDAYCLCPEGKEILGKSMAGHDQVRIKADHWTQF